MMYQICCFSYSWLFFLFRFSQNRLIHGIIFCFIFKIDVIDSDLSVQMSIKSIGFIDSYI